MTTPSTYARISSPFSGSSSPYGTLIPSSSIGSASRPWSRRSCTSWSRSGIRAASTSIALAMSVSSRSPLGSDRCPIARPGKRRAASRIPLCAEHRPSVNRYRQRPWRSRQATSTGSSSTGRRARRPPASPATSSSPRPARRSAGPRWRARPTSTARSRRPARRSTEPGGGRRRTSAPASCTPSPTRSSRTGRSSPSSSRATSARRSRRSRPRSAAPSRTSASSRRCSARSPGARTRSAARSSRTR